MNNYKPIAALWSRCENQLSIREWLKTNSILMIGFNKTVEVALDLINEQIFRVLVEEIDAQPNSDARRTWIWIDEARLAGSILKSGLLSYLSVKGRSKGVALVLGIQDMEGFREAAGEKIANEIVAQCSNKALLRMESNESATWASKILGQHEVIEVFRSENTVDSINEQARLKDTVLPSEFYSIPETSKKNGLTGYFVSPAFGASRRTMRPDELQKVVVSEDHEIQYAVQFRPNDEQWMREEDRDSYEERLGIELNPSENQVSDVVRSRQRLNFKHSASVH